MSKIEVNTVDAQCGSTVTIGSAGKTVSVPGNIVKTNALQASDGGNIVNQCGTTVTLGASGDTIALASGASQTGFGRTGTVDWVTTIKVTGDSPITAVSGKGYFLDTTAGTITINLPTSPSAGDIVSIKDYARTWATNAVTVGRGGSNMDGAAADTDFATDGLSLTLIYMDGTKGWSLINDDITTQTGASFIVATGGSPCSGAIVCTDYKVHTFTGPGNLCVSSAGNAAGSNTVDYLVVAGGAGGARCRAGGSGAGGYRESPGTASGCYSVSPLGAAPAVALPVSVTCYAIVVGAGGAGSSNSAHHGGTGNDSSFSTITSTAGGGGAGSCSPGTGAAGGSGGGGAQSNPAGAGNTPPFNPAQGFAGGPSTGTAGGGGGGGATAVGTPGNNPAGTGGAGATSSITGSPTQRAGGGGGGASPGAGAPGGAGGGGNGVGSGNPTGAGGDGTVNTGGGGGSTSSPGGTGGGGGSGIVVIRYKFQ
jgi:hypothetical protein